MKAVIVSIVFFSQILIIFCCKNGGIKFQNNCYYFETNETSFPNAEIICTSMNGHLTSIHDGFTNAILVGQGNDFFHDSTTSDFWIGLNSLMTPGNWTWTDNSNFDFNEWATSEPKNLSMSCGSLLLQNGYWSSADCFKLKPFVCRVPFDEYPVFENCTEGYVYFEPTHSCYGVANYDTFIYNWTLVEERCEEQGAHLVSLHSYEETNFISTYSAFAAENVWIGLYSIDNELTWKWSDGSVVDYLPWGSGYPKQNVSSCAFLSRGFIYDIKCSAIYYTICKKPALIPSY